MLVKARALPRSMARRIIAYCIFQNYPVELLRTTWLRAAMMVRVFWCAMQIELDGNVLVIFSVSFLLMINIA